MDDRRRLPVHPDMDEINRQAEDLLAALRAEDPNAKLAPFTELLLKHGADPNIRASIWKRLHPGHGDSTRHEYRDVTPLSYGRRFHAPIFVSQPALQLIESAGGVE